MLRLQRLRLGVVQKVMMLSCLICALQEDVWDLRVGTSAKDDPVGCGELKALLRRERGEGVVKPRVARLMPLGVEKYASGLEQAYIAGIEERRARSEERSGKGKGKGS